MFNLAQTAEQTALADALRQFGQRMIRPLMTHGGTPSQVDLDPVWRELHAMGLTVPVDEEHGGQGVPDPGTAALFAEEIGFADPGVGLDLVSRYRAAAMIDVLGDVGQRRAHLPGLLAGSGAGVAYYEGFGRTPLELRTTARRTVRGGWELTGSKIGVTRPEDLQVVVAADATTGELLAFVLEPGTPGVVITRDDAEVGKLGADAVRTGNIELGRVVLPESARLAGGYATGGDAVDGNVTDGDTTGGLAAGGDAAGGDAAGGDVTGGDATGGDATGGLAVHRQVAALRLGVAAVLLGTARAELAYAADYANTRVAFGQPIAAYQGVAFPLVEADMEIDTSRLLLWKAALDIEKLTEIGGIVTRTADVVARCHKTALEAGRHGINTLGGHGFISDHPLEQWHRGSASLAGLDFDPLETDCVVL